MRFTKSTLLLMMSLAMPVIAEDDKLDLSNLLAQGAPEQEAVEAAPEAPSSDPAADPVAAEPGSELEELQLKAKILEMQLEMERMKAANTGESVSPAEAAVFVNEAPVVDEDKSAEMNYTNPDFWPVEVSEVKSDPELKSPRLIKKIVDEGKVFGALLVTYEDYFTLAPEVRTGVMPNLAVVMDDGSVIYPDKNSGVGKRKPIDYPSFKIALDNAVSSGNQSQVNFLVNNYTFPEPINVSDLFVAVNVRNDILGCFVSDTVDNAPATISGIGSFDDGFKSVSQSALKWQAGQKVASQSNCRDINKEFKQRGDEAAFAGGKKVYDKKIIDTGSALYSAGLSFSSCSKYGTDRIVTIANLVNYMGGTLNSMDYKSVNSLVLNRHNGVDIPGWRDRVAMNESGAPGQANKWPKEVHKEVGVDVTLFGICGHEIDQSTKPSGY